MIYSMTGYGRAEAFIGDMNFLVEIKSLNGKQYDVRLTLPALLKPFEIEVRNILNQQLQRGSIECIITIKQNGALKPISINTALAEAYYLPISELADKLKLSPENILSTLLKLPDVVNPAVEVIGENDWLSFRALLEEAIRELNSHRENEGRILEADLRERIANIEKEQDRVALLEVGRRKKVKDGLIKLLEEHVGKDAYDANRLEQELIYYIEKIDISEEQVRLKNHCNYFNEILAEEQISKGKKLSFILQEIGREINTTGSKAYDSDIQKSVVIMKDELEKAKEQVLNVL